MGERQSVGGRNLRHVDGVQELLDVVLHQALGILAGRQVRVGEDVLGGLGAHPAEFLLHEGAEVAALGVLEHAGQDAQFHSVGVGPYLPGLHRQLIGAVGVQEGLALGIAVGQMKVRVGDGRLFQVVVHRVLAALVAAGQGDLDTGAVILLPDGLVGAEDVGLVLLHVQHDDETMGGLVRSRAAVDDNGLAGCQLAVHAGGGDADALLAAALLEAVELGAVEQLAEDPGDLGGDNARAVVLDDDPVAVFLGRAGTAVVLPVVLAVSVPVFRISDGVVLAGQFQAQVHRLVRLDLHQQPGLDAGLFAGVQAVVDSFLDGGQQGLGRGIETEQVAVLGEELADGDFPLAGGHGLGVLGKALFLRSGHEGAPSVGDPVAWNGVILQTILGARYPGVSGISGPPARRRYHKEDPEDFQGPFSGTGRAANPGIAWPWARCWYPGTRWSHR